MKNSIKNFLLDTSVFLIPLLSIIILVLILYTPRANSYWNFLRQAPFYAGIYFWQSQRPDAFHFFSAFILGIVADVLEGTPLGINLTTFLILYFVCIKFAMKFNIQKFSYSWLLFMVAIVIAMLSKALIVSISYRHIISLKFLSMEFFLTLATYPLLARIYSWVEKRCIPLEERYEKIKS